MEVIEEFKNYFRQFIVLSDNEWSVIFSLFEIKKLYKNHFYLKQGEVCSSVAFVNYGAIIYFKILDNADEITTDFSFRGEWVTDNFSRLNNSPSFINIKAIEDTELFIIKHKNLMDMFDQFPKLEKLGRIFMEQAFIKISQHSIDLQVLSATERYLKLLAQYPGIIQKVPQYHIANYLGLDPKSLSRIRKKISNK